MAAHDKNYYINEAFNAIQTARADIEIIRGNEWPDGDKFNDFDLVKIAAALLDDISNLQSNPEYMLFSKPKDNDISIEGLLKQLSGIDVTMGQYSAGAGYVGVVTDEFNNKKWYNNKSGLYYALLDAVNDHNSKRGK